MDELSQNLFLSSDFFSSCTVEDLKTLSGLSEVIALEDGKTIFQPGDLPEHFYLVREGEIVIQQIDDDENVKILARYLTGESLGGMDLFTNSKRTAYAVVKGPTKLLKFPRKGLRFTDVYELSPQMGARLLQSFLIKTSKRLREANVFVRKNSPLVQELRRQVYVDKLTGLRNKANFQETLSRMLESSKGKVGVLMYKPDNFKLINDNYGHEVGNQVLKSMANALLEVVPDRRNLFRYDGNENSVIFPDTDKEELQNYATQISSLFRDFDLSSNIKENSVQLSVSIGLALSPDNGKDVETLTTLCHDLVMQGRERGGNQCLFSEDFHS